MTHSAEVIALAVEIADSCARSDVECNLSPVGPYPGPWYDEKSVDDGAEEVITQSVRYLEMRGLLERKEGEPHLIRPRGEKA